MLKNGSPKPWRSLRYRRGQINMIAGALIVMCLAVLTMVWTMDFIFGMIEIKYNYKRRQIKRVAEFIDRNDISAEEAELLYKLID